MTSVNRLRGIQFRDTTLLVNFPCVKQKTQAIAAFLGVLSVLNEVVARCCTRATNFSPIWNF
jgi:hypothetical protein